MRFGSLFSGIGGMDLGLERSNMTCQWQVEIEDYPTKTLEKHWPEVHRERDIRNCGRHNLEPVDLICGGFPCQDISTAGKGAGLAGERSGLWYEMHRIISELRPQYVLVENVAALLFRGMDAVLSDLSEIGYDAEWEVIPASAVGAPHRRERVWIVGYTNSEGQSVSPVDDEASILQKDAANTNSKRLEGKRAYDDTQGRQEERRQAGLRNREEFRRYASWWQAESGIQPLAHGVPERMARLKSIGNAVVPQVVELIGRRILTHSLSSDHVKAIHSRSTCTTATPSSRCAWSVSGGLHS